MNRKKLFYFFSIFFLLFITYIHAKPAYAHVGYFVGNSDTCGKLNITATETPVMQQLNNGVQFSCAVVNPGQTQITPQYKLTVKVTSADGNPHSFTYSLNSSFCDAGTYTVQPGVGYCVCTDNFQGSTLTGNTPATLTLTRAPEAPYANCGSYQIDFNVPSVDGNTSCNYGTGGTSVGLAGSGETGVTCTAPPVQQPINVNVFVDKNANGVFDAGDTDYQGATVAVTGQGTQTTNAQGNATFNVNAGNYTTTLTVPAGYQMTTTNPVAVTMSGTQGQQVNFGIRPIPTYTVNGNVFTDANKNGIQDAGETNYTGGITMKSSAGTVTNNANGTYTITGLQQGTYTVSYSSLPNGYTMTSPLNAPPSFTITVGNTCTVNGAPGAACNAGNITNLNFGIMLIPTYTVSGNVFTDANKNGIQDAGETNYTGGITIKSSAGTVTNNANGTYTITGLLQGAYTVSYSSLPNGYAMTSPLNGPPPSFNITVGNTCTVNGAPGATCNAGNITNLNFGINKLQPWWQVSCADVREDGITDLLPAGISALVSNATCSNIPGLAFTSDTNPNFGQGQASSTNQVVGGISYPEVYSLSSSPVETAYSLLLAKAQNAGITPTNLSTLCTLTNCTLPATLPHGIYIANGNVTLNAFTFPANQNYVILINGTLTLNGNITVPVGSTALFSTSGNITVAPTVGSAANVTTANLSGWFVAGQSFIANSAGNCTDLRLNIAGSVVVDALGGGGTFQNNRDLCGNDTVDPTVSFAQRLDFIVNAPEFLEQQQTISQEVAP